jgi:FlaA1/EpsC-like NDP-sugar epimerase
MLAQIAEKYQTYKFVMISTDKAANPTSIMGCSKKLAELTLLNLFKDSKTQFVIVRFGNVLGSEGSAIPIFKKQIEKGGPITVTHPQMRRYFMTIPEAVLLTLQAGARSEHGDIKILDMGEQIKIVDIAENLIKLSGLKPYKDIEIKFTGIRPGEKLCEELWDANEAPIPTEHPKIYQISHVNTPENFNRELFHQLIEEALNNKDEQMLRSLLKKLVPFFADSTQKEIHIESI